MCATHGTDFYTSAFDAFNLIMRNLLRVESISKVSLRKFSNFLPFCRFYINFFFDEILGFQLDYMHRKNFHNSTERDAEILLQSMGK